METAVIDAMQDLAPCKGDRVFIPCDPYPPNVSTQLWMQYVLDQLTQRGITADQIVAKAGGIFEPDGYYAMRWYLRTHGVPTLILARSDLTVVGAYRALASARNAEVVVDEDLRRIRCLGLLDMQISQYLNPPLNSIRFSYNEIAKTVIKMIRQQHKTGRPIKAQHVHGQYVRRAS